MGVERWVDGRSEALPQLLELLSGELPTMVFDATGNAGSMMQAFNYVAHGGKLVFVGLFQGDVTFHDPISTGASSPCWPAATLPTTISPRSSRY